ncbi:MAG: hypothetical protein IPG21_11120 [Saprospiraceae bacterium]|nr:hypothetical protein [Candidatus Vicinibacter affinis]
MLAPIIPGVNDGNFDMVKQVAEAGAKTASYQIVRLNGDLQPIFGHWLEEQFPDRKERILNSIRSSRRRTGDSRFGTRMKGEETLRTSSASNSTSPLPLHAKDRAGKA